ncbi:DHH family phosphoesterase [Acidaminococcus sp.]|uniref:DHH family phosphoesterase n=1 Tax=Acidaminococcus sp. TaxID=1872103 RepID=UPI003D7EF0D2
MEEKTQRNLWQWVRIAVAIIGSVLVISGILINQAICTAGGFVAVMLVFYLTFRSNRLREAWFNHSMTTVVRNIERANNYASQRIPIGIGVFDKEGHLQWRNRLFNEYVAVEMPLGTPFEKVLPPPDNNFAALRLRDAEKQLKIGDRVYQMLVRRIQITENPEDDTGLALYLMDITDRERKKKKYEEEHPVVAYVQFDNYDDAMKGLNENERASVVVDVTKAIGSWVEEVNGYFQKYTEDMFVVGLSRKGLNETIKKKFLVLDRVRDIKSGNRTTPTISIGVAAEGRNLAEMSQKAQAALDLALGRGGDQAVVQIGEDMSFYGARGSVQAKNTRVRARIVAQAIHELMTGADQVFVMGHANEDYDALGAAIGVAKMALTLQKSCCIVTSGQGPSLKKLETVSKDQSDRYLSLFVDEDEALKRITPGSILVLVDHHRAMLSAAHKMLQAIRRRIIIDHHRRAEDAITDVMLQYMEPSTSSTCEMVTEILQYFEDKLQLSEVEATALYAGIVVDTKNFAVQTGERTFEAAAFLRRNGADPHLVSMLFKDDEHTVLTRAKIITEMQQPLPGLAVAVHSCSCTDKDTPIIVAQAADELLTMDDIRASVVFSQNENGVSISARSDGSVNVQVMMEELGGGGHQTVAGVQVKGVTAAELMPKVIELAKEQMKESDTDEGNPVAGHQEVG